MNDKKTHPVLLYPAQLLKYRFDFIISLAEKRLHSDIIVS